MPRKKVADPIDQILTFCETSPKEMLLLMQAMVARELVKRWSVVPVTRQRRIKPAPPAIPVPPPSAPVHDPTMRTAGGTPKRRRRMTAGSKPPVSEATPIVPGLPAPTADEGGDPATDS